MIHLPRSAATWRSDHFVDELKRELASLPLRALPLNDCTNSSGFVDPESLSFSLLTSEQQGDMLLLKLGVFFREVVSGCPCGDEPTMAENGYCQLDLEVGLVDGRARWLD